MGKVAFQLEQLEEVIIKTKISGHLQKYNLLQIITPGRVNMAFIMRRSTLPSLEICKGINKPVDKDDLVDARCLDFQKHLPKGQKPSICGRSWHSWEIHFLLKSKQQFKRSVLGSVLFNVLTGHLEKDEVRKVTKDIKLCKVLRSSTNHEVLQRNHMYLSKKISQNIYSRSGKCSEKGRSEDQRQGKPLYKEQTSKAGHNSL